MVTAKDPRNESCAFFECHTEYKSIECFALSCIVQIQILAFIDKYRLFSKSQTQITPCKIFSQFKLNKCVSFFALFNRKRTNVREKIENIDRIYIFRWPFRLHSFFARKPLSDEISFSNTFNVQCFNGTNIERAKYNMHKNKSV